VAADCPAKQQLSGLLVGPLVLIGVLAAVLVWEIEHIGSIQLAVVLVAATACGGVVAARYVRKRIEQVTEHYEGLLQAAREASQAAEEASRVKDEFLAVLSHELRTPLNSVLGWARMLRSGKLDTAQSAQGIRAIERAGWTQSHLIENLLDISQLLTGRMQIRPRPMLLESLVTHTADSFRTAAQAKQISLNASCDPDIGVISADPDRLQQILWNLLSNAVKFTPHGGHVDVRCVRGNDGTTIRISVTDTGIGLKPDEAQHLFERFRQLDSSSTRQYGGLGMGLGIVRHLAELHGGTIAAHSAGPGAGCRFEIRLPMPSVTPQVHEPSPENPETLLRGVNVLIVDDNELDVDLTRWSLEQHGAVVSTASTASEALECYRRKPPDVLVCDLRLPDEDGFQLIREIRAIDATLGRETPAAAVTALGRADDRHRALDAGFQAHVTKPFEPSVLAATVGRLAHGVVGRQGGMGKWGNGEMG
jgi:signal transduction histidine kinase/CheY-like chemotaxis protein